MDKQALRERYSPKPAPECHICGKEMTVQRISSSRITYGCTGATYDDNGCHYTEGRSIADDHYEQSRVTIVDVSDPDVLALLDELDSANGYASAYEAEKWHYHGLAESEGERADRAEKRVSELECIATDYGVKFQKAQDALKHQALLHKSQMEAAEKRLAGLSKAASVNSQWKPDVCPVTGRKFFMWIEHETLGYVPTYGGPFDSYTIPTRDSSGEFSCERYDHDFGGWVGGEFIGLYLIDDDEQCRVCELEERIAELEAREIKPAKGEVLVVVSGFTGCGKSAIAGEIEIAMKAIGVPVQWTNGDAEKHMTGADWLTAIEMYKPTVRIVEVNVPRAAGIKVKES
ncbi:ead/Ea22-like family protein [Salmonella enterica subsp. salamae]|nr:ead/Ea22-like family protein [Salmonella enterica]ECC1628218.1 ead/Ea22-like family protein [Salmonella enterica subsp. salamae]ECI4106662.1 ead/Ea22-like family protein [Salmonella enterica subsp. salamae]EDV2642264.1 ead/Ea22-like family protein [Salmonella enterica subsp. salamae]EEA0860264.1 hypothetical protein [Salmonella enterica subsp. salamae]